MKLNRKWLLVIALVLSMTMAISGTMAYLQDAATDVNVMTLGSVKIEQHEYERVVEDGAYKTDTIDNQTSYVLQDYTQGKPLLPTTEIDENYQPINHGAGDWDDTTVRMSQVDSYGGMQVFTSENAVDKFVTVENTGRSDAYVRTFVAIEVGSGDASLIGSSYHNNWSQNEIGQITVEGNNYNVYEYVYRGASDGSRHVNGILPAGETSYPNLSQVYLKSVATNEDLEAIDGNGNDMLDILVLSQAIQADGFANATTALTAGFGAATPANVAEWFGGVVPVQTASTAAELTSALENGGTIVLTGDVTLEADVALSVAKGSSATLDLAGHILTGSSEATGKNRNLVTVKGDLTVIGGTVSMTHTGDNMGWGNLVSAFSVEGGELTLDGVTITASGSDMTYGVDVNTTLGETVLNIEGNTSITSSYAGVRIFNNNKTAKGTVNLNSGTVTGNGTAGRDIWVHNPSANAIDANGIVNVGNGAAYEVETQSETSYFGRIYRFN